MYTTYQIRSHLVESTTIIPSPVNKQASVRLLPDIVSKCLDRALESVYQLRSDVTCVVHIKEFSSKEKLDQEVETLENHA